MAQRKVTRTLIGALLLAFVPYVASAQEAVGPQDLTRSTADPVEKLVGLWRVDRVEGLSSVVAGQVLRIDRQSVETLTLGTCSNPGFDERLGAITVSCLGQDLASAAWDPQAPGMLRWSEGSVQAVLSRISGTETMDSPPPAEAAAPEEGVDEGTEEAE